MPTATVTSKGQVTLPQKVREALASVPATASTSSSARMEKCGCVPATWT